MTTDPRFEPLGGLEDAKAAKRLKKAEKALDTRQLDSWERYRALNDQLDTYIDMIEIADRKARFALLVLGALNALNLVFVARPQVAGVSGNPRLLAIYAATYIIISLFLLTRTIGVLRPRAAVFMGQAGLDADTPHVRFIGDVMRQSDDQYYDAWQRIEVGELNRQLSNHVRNLASINLQKYRALEHVYHGLIALAFLTAFLVAAIIAVRLYM